MKTLLAALIAALFLVSAPAAVLAADPAAGKTEKSKTEKKDEKKKDEKAEKGW